MKKFFFDIQRFDDLATVNFGGGTASISAGITVTDETLATGSYNADTILTGRIYYNAAFISSGDGEDSIKTIESIFVSPVTILGGAGNDTIDTTHIYGSTISVNGGEGSDFISIHGSDSSSQIGDSFAFLNSTVTIDGGGGADTISVRDIHYQNDVTIIAGAGDSINVGSGGANYLFDSTDAVTINGAKFSASAANTSASLYSSDTITSIKSAWNGTIAISGTNSLADIDGSIVSATGNYQIVDGKLASSSDISTDTSIPPVNTDTAVTSGWATITNSNGSTIIDYNNNVANGTDNADTIQASVISNTVRAVYGNGGDDVVSIVGSPNGIEFSNVTLEGGEGNDAININGTIDGIHPSTVSIGSGGGNDTVNIYGGNEGIHGGTTGITDKSSVSIDLGDGDDQIFIQGVNDKGIDISNVQIGGGTGNDFISISGGNYGIGGVDGFGNATVSIDGGVGVDTIFVNSINGLSDVSIVAGSGDNINVGSGSANYLFNSTDTVTINGATFKANSADSSANLVSYAEGTSIGSAWNGTVALSGTDSLADIDGSIVSAAGNYQIVDGKFAGTVEPSITPVINPNGKNYDIVFIIDVSGSMDYYIDDVKNNVNSFVTKLQNSGVGNVRFGLISYETDASAQIFSNETNLTSDINEFKSAIDNLSTYGGTEYGLTAVELAMSIVSDEDNTTKRFLVVTDEDCDDSSMFNPTNIDNALKSRGIIMDVVGSEGSCRTEWEPLANATNGKFYLLGSGFPSIFSDITTDIVNVIDLNLVPENQTGYFIATQNSDTYTTPIFQTTGATVNDTAVGAVNEVYIYVADSDTDRQQTVIIPENWNVTATNNDDKLVINGVSATVTGAEGSDVFSLGSDTRTVTLMDLNIDEDKLSFGNYITPGTMRHSIEDNHLVLSADDLRVDIPAMSEMTDEFLDYTVSNAGNSATISELINGDGQAIISFAHWSFTFTQASLDHFGF